MNRGKCNRPAGFPMNQIPNRQSVRLGRFGGDSQKDELFKFTNGKFLGHVFGMISYALAKVRSLATDGYTKAIHEYFQ